MNYKTLVLITSAAATELIFRVELPDSVQNALWGLAILIIGLIGIWVKGTITRLNEKHDLELDAIRANQEQSKAERKWLLETTQKQIVQIETLQKDNERLMGENRERDMLLGEQKATNEITIRERDKLATQVEGLQKRTDERHDAINKAQAETAAALEFARKETDRADAAEGDFITLKKQFDELQEQFNALQKQVDNITTPPIAEHPAEVGGVIAAGDKTPPAAGG